MRVNNYVLVRRADDNVGYFKKDIEIPCIPPIGTKLFFDKSLGSLSFEVNQITYSESSGEFSFHFDLNIDSEEVRLDQSVSDSFFPKQLIKLGFELEWLEEKYEHLLVT